MHQRIHAYQNILKDHQDLNAVVLDLSEKALSECDARPEGSCADLLLAIKDNLNLEGTPTTCASYVLEGYRSTYTATVVQRLQDAGGVVVAKTNMDEFAMGSSNEYSCYGPVRNPLDPNLVPGGSSGGSAAVVATGMVDAALGSDTGGSVRQPAAFCGVYGLKPTYGRVSRYGLVAFASSFDQVGVFARDTSTAAQVFETVAGHDPHDSTSAPDAVTHFSYDDAKARGLTIGIAEEFTQAGLDKEIKDRYEAVRAHLEREGCTVKPISLPHTRHGIAAYYILTTAEASSNLARFDGVRYGSRRGGDMDLESLYRESRSLGFGPEVQRRIMLGTYVLSAGYMDKYYIRAQKVRRLIQKDFLQAFDEVDILLTPATPTFPFPVGQKVNDPMTMYLSDVYTVPMNLAGVPALTVPAGKGSNDLPIGLQLSAPYFGEEALFQISQLLEDTFQA